MSRNNVYYNWNEAFKLINFVSTVANNGDKLQLIFALPSTSGDKIVLNRFLIDVATWTSTLYWTSSVQSASAYDFGNKVAFDKSTETFYFGMNHMWDSSYYSATIIKYKPSDWK